MTRLITILFFLAGCSNKEELILSKKTYLLKIDSVLNSSGTKSILYDNNGYYHLKLDSTKNQTLSRVTGKILLDGTKAQIKYFKGLYTIVSLPPLIASKDELVPTSNFASYSGKDGEINNMIAPIYKMKGDTLILKTRHSFSNQIIYTKIVLEQ